MRRSTRFFLAALLVFAALVGGYTVYWRIAAAQFENRLAAWAQSVRARNVYAHWQSLRVGGYPFAFQLDLRDAELSDRALTPPPRLRLAALRASARPWDLRHWRLAAPAGISGTLAGAAGLAPLTLSAHGAVGALSVPRAGGLAISLDLREVALSASRAARIGLADLRIAVPSRAPRSKSDPDVSLAADLRQIKLPARIGALGDRIAEMAFGVTVNGPIPAGSLPQAAAAWRDAGGAIALDHLHLEWGGLDATATGSFALDRRLQPVGGFSGAIEGYDKIIAALVADGRLRANQGRLAHVVLTMLAKAGPDGRPQIATSFTIQHGKMYLGPAKIGNAPRIDWR